MNIQHIEEYAKIPQPEQWNFIKDLKSPQKYYCHKFDSTFSDNVDLANGVELFFVEREIPETALKSLQRIFKAREIPEKNNGYPICFHKNSDLKKEEYHIDITKEKCSVFANDSDGFRRAIYFLEDRILENCKASITQGTWQRRPFIKNRISRCFFGPTNRPPFMIDELMNEIDYYPDEYLDKLAHEGINGLWMTIYFRDLPSSFFPGRGSNFEQRMRKLRKTVDKCARYGIRIFIFLSEPKKFGLTPPFQPVKDTEKHPEVLGTIYKRNGLDLRMFCTSTDTGIAYIQESVAHIFSAVPELGGIINIMLGEDNGSCAAFETTEAEPIPPQNRCPRCSKRDYAEIFRDQALAFSQTMHKYNPDAEYIGWFYAPRQHDGSAFMKRLAHIAEKWPKEASIMFNFESGGTSMQLGKKRIVLDYSLAYVGPSELFKQIVDSAPRTAAKLQVGCSHEDASVPFIPVPLNLYDKYHFLHEHKVSSVMQCWYFGNYPGLMNKAAGELSFEPFPKSAHDFLVNLAHPVWGCDAEKIAEAWTLFSNAYRLFPSNVNFEWYGPLHQSIAWPLHLFPVDKPISPSWLLKTYPEVSGDRIGECFGYFHTLQEGIQLCTEMQQKWQMGVQILEALRASYKENIDRLMDINLASAIGIQMKSTLNILRFYALREEMLFYKKDNLKEMKQIVEDEIVNTKEMITLCQQDSRLGFHPEAEGYLFYPEKLQARITLLQELLNEDFSRFALTDKWIKEYTGEAPNGTCAFISQCESSDKSHIYRGYNVAWSGEYDNDSMHIKIYGVANKHFILAIEPCRLWPLFQIEFYPDHTFNPSSLMFTDPPDINVDYEEQDITVTIPLSLFDGLRRHKFPMRMNIWNRNNEFYWTEPHYLQKGRLQFGNVTSDNFGWIYFS